MVMQYKLLDFSVWAGYRHAWHKTLESGLCCHWVDHCHNWLADMEKGDLLTVFVPQVGYDNGLRKEFRLQADKDG